MLVINSQQQHHHLGNSQIILCGHNVRMRYPNKIRELSERKGWTQADLSRATGYEPPVVGRFWHGQRKLHQDHLEIFSNAFQCRPEDVISSQPLKKDNDELNYTEVALIYAMKSIIGAILASKGKDKGEILRESFKSALVHYRAENKPNAVSVMDTLLAFVDGPQHQEEQSVIRRLLELSPGAQRKT